MDLYIFPFNFKESDRQENSLIDYSRQYSPLAKKTVSERKNVLPNCSAVNGPPFLGTV